MFDFVLDFIPDRSDYLLCAASEYLAGQAQPVPFEACEMLRSSQAAHGLMRNLRLDAASSEGGRDQEVSPCPGDPVRLGKELYQQIFCGEIGDLFSRARKLAREQRAGLRILIKAWHQPEIHDLPWELLHDGRRFLAQSTETPVVRYLKQRQPLREFRIEPPIRLLLTTACPRGVPFLDVEEEEPMLRAALAPLGDRVLLTVEHQVNLERLRFLLFRARAQGRPFQVWHHSGHGYLAPEGFSLALTAPDQSLQLTKVEELEAVLTPCEELKIAVLSACEGASAAGLATALANLNIPAVIGFRESIYDTSALVFAEALYQGLCETTLERALTRARLELRDAGYWPLDWSYPLLFARTSAAGPWL